MIEVYTSFNYALRNEFRKVANYYPHNQIILLYLIFDIELDLIEIKIVNYNVNILDIFNLGNLVFLRVLFVLRFLCIRI